MTQGGNWLPYCGPGSTPDDWIMRWNLDPVLLGLLAIAAVVVWLRMRGRERALGMTAIGLFFVAFVSPLCALSSALFAARTVHHVILIAMAAPLLAWSLPRLTTTGFPSLATATQAVVFWGWHAPDAYGTALSNDAIYWLMQITILGSGVWFWAAVRRTGTPAAIISLLAAMVAMGLLGALLTFADAPLYAPHLLTTQIWGLAPLDDQRLAGLIMWAPAAAIYLAGALWLLGRLIGPEDAVESA